MMAIEGAYKKERLQSIFGLVIFGVNKA